MPRGIITYSGTWEVQPVPEVSYAEYVLDAASQHGGSIAMICSETKEEITYTQFVTKTRNLAAALQQKLGLSKDQHAAIALPNCIEFPVSSFAVTLCGATAAFVNPIYKPRELDHVINIIKPDLWICIPEFLPSLRKCQKHNEETKIVVVGSSPDCFSLEDLVSEGDWNKFSPVEINPKEDVATMPFSSGTTGFPKGVMLTHHSLVTAHQQLKTWTPFDKASRVIGLLPMFHQYGNCLVTATLQIGGTIIFMQKFGLSEFLKTLQDYQVTHLPLVPPVALLLCKNPVVDNYKLSLKYILSSAASLSPDLIDEMVRKFGCTVEQGYGMTECTLATHYTPHGICKHGAVGRVMPYWEVKVTDPDTGAILGPNEVGEICVKGQMLLKGYRGDPGSTAALIDSEGWLHTGDFGWYDEEEWFFYKDRMKELIKYKGNQVSPSELEHLLLTHPDVLDAAVIGLPDEEAGELPRAFVVKRRDANITVKEVEDFVAENVAPFKKLRGGVVFIDAIPKSASGKILRRELRTFQQS